MKILRIVYDWPEPWDGLAPHPYELTSSQLKLGHTFEIFCGSWPNSGKIQTFPGVKFHAFFRELVPGTLILTNALVMFFYYLWWRTQNQVDIIHVHGHFGFWIYLYRAFLLKNFPKSTELKTPLVAHFHNTVEGRWQSAVEKGIDIKPESQYLSWPLAKISDENAVKVANACVFVSTGNRDQAIQFYKADPKKCFLVETGVNTGFFKPIGGEELEKTRRDLGFDLLDKLIVNVGAMVERKNIHTLVEAFKYLPNQYKLLLVGPGDSSYLERLDLLIKANKLEERIVRAGYTPYPQTPVAYQAADLFVLPSSFEGLPKVVMESLACGTPVLASGFKLSAEIFGLNYINKLDPKEIATQILDLTSKPKNVDVNTILNNYSWDQRVKELEKVYEFVTNPSSASTT